MTLDAILTRTSGDLKEIEIEQKNYPTFLVYDGDLYILESYGQYQQSTASIHVINPNSVRCKFICQYSARDSFNEEVTSVVMTPVISDPPSKENLSFWKATPAGQITLQLTNPQAVNHFRLGTTQYVDFTLAPESRPEEDTAIWKQ